MKVTSALRYTPVAQKIILAAKESHIRSADLLIAEAITHSITSVLREECVDVIIPIPSRQSVTRLRGRQFIEDISRIAVSEIGIPVLPILHHTRPIRDQSGLDITARWNNLDGALVVDSKQPSPGRVLLVDDLVTTGATLAEGARALRYSGIEAVGAVTAALAQPVR